MHTNIYLPDEFLRTIEQILPSQLTMDDFIAACQRPLRKSIRVNTLKISVADFCQRAEENGWRLTPIPWCPEGFWVEPEDFTTPIGNTFEHMTGLFYIQEASSMMPVSALFHQQETAFESVLDMAAAPGSKTTQIAALMNNEGIIVANEFSASRTKALYSNIERCGIRNSALTTFDGRVFGEWLPEQFDAVLIDAPCSGEGTVRKDPDAMKNWSPASIAAIAETQKALIESAFYALKPGGILVYSTCTLSREENQNICYHLKQVFGDAVTFESLASLFPQAQSALTEEGFLHIFPQIYDCEGFFVARIRKTASVPTPQITKRLGKFPFSKATHKQCQSISEALKQSLDIDLPARSRIWLRDNEVWLFPEALEPMIGRFKFSRMGIKLAEAHKKGYRWQHQVVTALTSGHETKAITLSLEDARQWFMGKDIRPEQTEAGQGEVLVQYQGVFLGLGKWVGNRIKNSLPRELVRDGNLF
ncbi:16S rRNA (cytosine(1407)-C(5))-methyltransferase RsmF [Vibrio gazogenes]|uniref:Ribosomal RNA small subunit methyltransferase F n=1 Tax=Vibrio gazogenes DSM 21264 = NBRC 103151 TaxID=1123492 RepID=A0A1M4ZMK2_VIBGA|nr:16S rRNA (cytosine(1407)-C(5))-methyltransferase RsmF [Vibrio gazogenes]USP15163.1 16S rRNA (cytosine(1407)-C(5))-methyltransferase RsmF [Vibrio gazogenes]SHF19224.1 16S rRNA (cytosine1407-C5)-methyltransferase [Vibrio gazogenes DSM 21264] [Vibrio gazogenes DSM 21264 = NBRC 103151]